MLYYFLKLKRPNWGHLRTVTTQSRTKSIEERSSSFTSKTWDIGGEIVRNKGGNPGIKTRKKKKRRLAYSLHGIGYTSFVKFDFIELSSRWTTK